MADTSCSAPAKLQAQLRAWGIVVIPFSIISFGIAVGLNAFLDSPRLGGWYIALISLFSGIAALAPRSRGIVIVILVVSIIACILGFAISVVDGSSAAVISSIEACAHPVLLSDGTQSFTYFGTQSYFPLASNCSLANLDFDCSCVNSQSNGDCFLFDGQPNCNLVTSKFVHMLRAATAFDVLTLLAVFCLSLSSCCSICCPANGCFRDPQDEEPQFAANPTFVTAQTQPAVVFVGTVQPQYGNASGGDSATPYNQHPQIAALSQYSSSASQGPAVHAVPVVYGKA